MSVRQLDSTLRVNTHLPKDNESFAMLMSVESPKSRSTSATRLDKDRPHLSISLDDAIVSLQFDEMLLFAGFRLVIAIAIFAFVCILIGSKKPTQQLFDQQRAVTNALAPQPDGHSFKFTQFLDIDNVDSLFDWLTSTLIPSVFPSTQANDRRLEKRRGYLDFSNQILGGLILEATVKGFRRCKSSEAFVNLHTYCVGKEESPSSPIFLDMNMSTTEALAAVTELKSNDIWSNYHTSLFRVTVATYNSEIDTFSVTHLDVNFRDEGRIDPTVSTETVPDHREQPMTRSVVIIGIGLVYYAIMLLYIEIVKAPSQPHSVLHQGFNRKCEAILWEGVVIIFKFGAIPVFFVLSYRVLTTNIDGELEELAASYSKSSDESYRALQEVIEALDGAAFWVNLLSVVGAFTILQMGFFAIRQLRFHPRLNVFARTVAASFRQFRDFVVIFIVIFMTFAFAGNSLFGKFVLEFSTASNSVVSCANMLFQTFDYGSIETFHGSGIFYWTFMVVVNITLLNMMLAIVMRVYETITQDGYDGEISQRLLTRIRDNYPYRDALESLRFWRSDKRKRCFPSKHDPARSKPSDTDTEAMEYFKKLRFDIRKLTRDNVICEGRIFPPLLLKILKAKRKYLRRFPNDQLPIVKISATTLTELFPAAKISEEEMDATFAYLRDGFILHEVVSENASNSTLSKGIDEAKSENVDNMSKEIAELNARVAGIECKLDKLLEVMASYHHTPSH